MPRPALPALLLFLESDGTWPAFKNPAPALNISVTCGVIPVSNQESPGGAIMASRIITAARHGGAGEFRRKGIGRPATRTALRGIAVAAAAGLLAACGGAGTHAAGGKAHLPGASHRVVVSARKLPGVGTVLVNRSGKTIYSPQQEAHGKILCTGSCLSFWLPVPAGAGAALKAASGVTGALGTIHRPDGQTQLTYNRKPLYTFQLDLAPGQAHGNNFTDHFGSTSVTWHAITTSGSPAGTGQPGNGGGYAYQGSSPGY
jgi:predicted lipoprotein with Yx(FWY)xxD motif